MKEHSSCSKALGAQVLHTSRNRLIHAESNDNKKVKKLKILEKKHEACGGVGSTKTGRLYFRGLLSMGISSRLESTGMSNIGCRAQQQFAGVAASAEAWVAARHLLTPLLGGAGPTKHLLLQGRLLGSFLVGQLQVEPWLGITLGPN